MDYSTIENLKTIVEESISGAERFHSKLPPEIFNLRGFSTPKIRHLLNNLCSYGNCRYLEIGVWAGSTLIPALWKNNARSQAIDNYSQFGPQEAGFDAQKTALELIAKHKEEIGRQGIWNGDCMNLPDEVIKPANVFLYDGDHSAEMTEKAIVKYGKRCGQPFILLVDDLELSPTIWLGLQKALNTFTVHKYIELKKSEGYHEGLWVGVVEVVK